jgi:hypothetical protein
MLDLCSWFEGRWLGYSLASCAENRPSPCRLCAALGGRGQALDLPLLGFESGTLTLNRKLSWPTQECGNGAIADPTVSPLPQQKVQPFAEVKVGYGDVLALVHSHRTSAHLVSILR